LRTSYILTAAAATVLLALGARGASAEPRGASSAGPPVASTVAASPTRTAQRPLARSRGRARVQTIATRLDNPWDMAFMPDGRALITETVGRVRLFSRGRVRGTVATVQTRREGEGGLLGVAIDPDFRRNRFVYLYRSLGEENVVTRYRYGRGGLGSERNIISGIRFGQSHDGGRIRFGPDRHLYVTSGDSGTDALGQDNGSLNGKILRMSPRAYRGAGGRPEIYSTGHRNPQGLAWQPGTRRLVATEHGPTGNDEINAIRRGQNYGWPLVIGTATQAGFVPPLALYSPAIAPSGATFVRLPGSRWTGSYLVAALRGQQLRRIRFSRTLGVVGQEVLFERQYGRLRSVVEGPDGALYVLTSNAGSSRGPTDDRLLRVVPPAR
jgi:glucose/arabinose dehydrogenase